VALAGDRVVLRDADGRVQTLAGHEDGALCVAFSAEGAFVATGGRDQTVRVWRAADGAEVATFDGHVGAVRAVAFAPDRRHVYSGGADGTVRRWPVRLVIPAAKAVKGTSSSHQGRARSGGGAAAGAE
jgi:WD40 repeat protein